MFKVKYFIRKFVVSMFATLFVCLSMMLLDGVPTFIETFLFLFILVFPAYLVGGNAYSILIDFLWYKSNRNQLSYFSKFISNLLIYALGGIIVSILYLLILTSGNLQFGVNYRYYLFGIIAAILYYIVDEILIRFGRSFRKQKTI